MAVAHTMTDSHLTFPPKVKTHGTIRNPVIDNLHHLNYGMWTHLLANSGKLFYLFMSGFNVLFTCHALPAVSAFYPRSEKNTQSLCSGSESLSVCLTTSCCIKPHTKQRGGWTCNQLYPSCSLNPVAQQFYVGRRTSNEVRKFHLEINKSCCRQQNNKTLY